MTTEMIAALANRGAIATADFHLGETLRYEVIPEFFSYLPESVWRRRTSTVPLLVNNRGPYDLQDDFYSMISIHVPNPEGQNITGNMVWSDPGLQFIGEDPALVAQAESATQTVTQGESWRRVSGYYIVPRNSDGQMKALKLSGFPDRAYTAYYNYVAFPYFGNGAESVEMNQYIPEPLQQGVVQLLRAKIYLDRYGEGDQRAQGALAQFQQVLDKAIWKYALSRRNYAVYITS
jgi:hypothetical protein